MSSSDPIPRLNAALEGRYHIERELGAGGMATVYLAQDLKHGREVALKVLRPELSAVVGAERFVSEIRTTANLKHPHILPLFDSGEADGFLFYVMPYVEGESLRVRLERESQLGVDEAVRIASRVASALEHAHRHGVLHRDIKPANILLQDGEPVVADFGIALALGAAGGGRLTETGMSLGTPSYMSPEQATGEQPLDARSDVYSLACVLYEMLAGTTPFGEGTPQAILARIVTKDAEPVKRHRRLVPNNVDAAIRKALERAPADRFESAQDFARALTDRSFRYGEELLQTASRPWTLPLVTVASALVALAGSVLWGPEPSAAPVPPAVWRMAGAAPNHPPLQDFGIGPLGTGVIYVGGDGRVWHRRWEDPVGSPVTGSEGGFRWMSRDGRYLVETDASGEIRLIPLEGTEPPRRKQVDGGRAFPSDDGYLYFYGREDGAVYRVPETLEGEPEWIGPELRDGELGFDYYDVLPGGEKAIYQVAANDSSWIEGYDLTTGARSFLTVGLSPQLAATGHLLFGLRTGQIMAATLDPETLELGVPISVVEGPVRMYQHSYMMFETASDGTLAYWDAGRPEYELVWVTKSGIVEPVVPGWFFDAGADVWPPSWSLSPDGSSIAVTIMTGDDMGVWVREIPEGPVSPLAGSEGFAYGPTWLTTDTVIYAERATGVRTGTPVPIRLLRQASGADAPEVIFEGEDPFFFPQVVATPDRESVLVTKASPSWQLHQLPLAGGGEMLPILGSPRYAQFSAAFSPNGQWLAYVTWDTPGDQGGDVAVRPFPELQPRYYVSSGGGTNPVWSPDGTEIFYVTPDSLVMSARIRTEPRFEVLEREPLFPLAEEFVIPFERPFASVADDGRFLMMRGGSEATFVVVQNFFERLERLVPN